jgi:DNA-binding response OmpR family regulator
MKNPLLLIVDDIEDNISILHTILSKEPYRFAVASNGEEALSLIAREAPDLSLLDVMLPDKSGFDVLRQINEDSSIPQFPVIFITARTGLEDKVEGFRLGGVDYITKPFQGEEVLARVRTHLELKQRRDEQAELISQLTASLEEVRQLRGIIPICASCKKIRNDEGYWQQVEEYISSRSEVEFTHGLCPDCIKKFYPDYEDGDDKEER